MHRFSRLELHECYVQSSAEKLTDWSPASEDIAEESWNPYTPVLLVQLRRSLVEESTLILSGLRRMMMCWSL